MSKMQRVKMELSSKVSSIRSITKKDVLSFAKASLPTLAMMGLYMLPSAVGFASEIKTGIDPLDKPLNVLTGALTGPIPKLVIAGAIGMGGIALGAGKFMENMFGNGIDGMMF